MHPFRAFANASIGLLFIAFIVPVASQEQEHRNAEKVSQQAGRGIDSDPTHAESPPDRVDAKADSVESAKPSESAVIRHGGSRTQADEQAENASLESSLRDRSPIDLAMSPDGKWIVTANQIANTATLIRATQDIGVVDEIAIGDRPIDIAFTASGDQVVISCAWSGELHVLRIRSEKLERVGIVHVGFQPHGIAITHDGKTAYVGLVASGQVAEVDLDAMQVNRRFDVGHWPRSLILTRDDRRLAILVGGESKVAIWDVESGEPLYEEPLAYGTNFGQATLGPEGRYVYFPWMVYRTNPISVSNIRRGWVLASRIGRVRLDGPAYREALSLDVPRRAVADPYDLVISGDGQRMVASAAGTHELLVYRLPDLPFVAQGGPGDLIDRRLQNDESRFHRVVVGGRPMGLKLSADDKTVWVANYLLNSVQVVDLQQRKIINEIPLGGPGEKTPARRGMEIFYDAQRSLDQWYSCHSCHQEGGVNARPMDTHNDGSEGTVKTVLPLYNVTKTFPWTWHGWQRDLSDAMRKSITSTMQGEPPSQHDVDALIAFLRTLDPPPNPFRGPKGQLSESAARGKKIFFSRKAACVDCHHGPYYTDGQIHDVGTGSDLDHYDGYNTPSLIGTYQKVRWLHQGRARDLHRVITDLHRPDQVNGLDALTSQETTDLIEFLKSL